MKSERIGRVADLRGVDVNEDRQPRLPRLASSSDLRSFRLPSLVGIGTYNSLLPDCYESEIGRPYQRYSRG